MIHDPIVEEIHRIRKKILDECNGDLDQLMDRFQAAEIQDRNRLITWEEFQRKPLTQPELGMKTDNTM